MGPARLRATRVSSVVLSLTLAFAVCSAASLQRSPYLQNVGTETATIIWTSPEQVSAQVRYSENGDLTRAVSAQVRVLPASAGAPVVYQYRVELRNLKPSREYLYEVVAGDRVLTEDLRFRTAGPGPFRFLVFGDSGTGTDDQMALARRMATLENPSLVIHTGDLSQEKGTPEQLDHNYLRVYADLMARAPFFASPGNHDYYTDSGNPCFAIHAAPAAGVAAEDLGRYYSYEWGNVHFVSLNSNLLEYPDASARMLQWLERDLASQKNFWKVVYFHHLPYPTGHHLDDPVSALVRERVVPILERYGVQVVFTGHEHSYQRTHPLRAGEPVSSGGTVYVTTGGGGGVLHYINPGKLHAVGKSVHHYIRADVRGSRMTLTVIGVDGEIVDTVTITAPTQPVVEAVVNSGSFSPALASGSLISIFGRDLAVDERSPATPALELAGTSVTMNGDRVPLLYAAPDQINAQLPYGITGDAVLRVNTRTSSFDVPVQVAATAPAVLQVPFGFRNYPSVWSSSGTLVTRRTPVHAGEYVTVYLVGLGEVAGATSAGQQAPGDPPALVRESVQVQFGSTTVSPAFAGLTPGFCGLYQINVRVPDGVAPGAVALRVVGANSASEPITLFVGN